MPVIDIKQVSKIYGNRNANEVYALNTILMVTHDTFSASYCRRILFIQDGQLVKELYRSSSREIFYKQILDILGHYGSTAAAAGAAKGADDSYGSERQ